MRLIDDISKFCSKHSADIKFGVGLAGMFTAIVVTAVETSKVVHEIDAYKEANNKESLTFKETFKIAWKHYIHPVALTSLSAGCLISSKNDYSKENAALTAAYTLSETALKSYEQAVKSVDEETRKIITETIADQQVEKHPANTEVVVMSDDDVLCYDAISSRYWRCSMDKIDKAVNRLNYRIASGQDFGVPLNDFYYEVDLSPMDGYGDRIGWNISTGLIDISYDVAGKNTGKPALVIKHLNEPVYGFDKIG